MKIINLIFDNWINDFPIPNGILYDDFLKYQSHPQHSTIQKVRESELKSNYNETFNTSFNKDGVFHLFQHKDILVRTSNKIENNCLNFYFVMPRNHLKDIEEFLPLFQTKLESGLNILFATFHEMDEYPIFQKWVNENQYKNNIYIISPSYNMKRFFQCNVIFFPYFLFNANNEFSHKAEKPEWNVCSKEEYLNTPKEKLFVSWNRNVQRMHRLLFYEFLKEQNQLDNNFVSFIEFPTLEHYRDTLIGNPKFLNKQYLENYLNSNGGVRYDIDLKGTELSEVQNKLANRFNVPDVYKKSYFSIVVETNYFETAATITEKIVRPIANFHPFVVIGKEGIYKELQKFGYQIPNLINYEKIDNTINPELRLQYTFEEIKSLINNFKYDKNFLYSHCEVLEHNQNLLLNFNKNDMFYFMYSKIAEFFPNLNSHLI